MASTAKIASTVFLAIIAATLIALTVLTTTGGGNPSVSSAVSKVRAVVARTAVAASAANHATRTEVVHGTEVQAPPAHYAIHEGASTVPRGAKVACLLVDGQQTTLFGRPIEAAFADEWYRNGGLRFPARGDVAFVKCDRADAPSVAEALYAKGVRQFVGSLFSQTVTDLKPFMDAHPDAVLQSTASTANSLQLEDNIYRVPNNDSVSEPYLVQLFHNIFPDGGADTVIVFDEKDVWSVGMRDILRKTLPRAHAVQATTGEPISHLIGGFKRVAPMLTDHMAITAEMVQQRITGKTFLLSDVAAFDYTLDSMSTFFADNDVYTYQSYVSFDGIQCAQRLLGGRKPSAFHALLFYPLLNALRWVVSGEQDAAAFMQRMGSDAGMMYFDKYGESNYVRMLLVHVTGGISGVDFEVRHIAAFISTFGSFDAKQTSELKLK